MALWRIRLQNIATILTDVMPASLLTLVVIWYSRCSAIVNIRHFKEISVQTAWYAVIGIWTFVTVYYPIVEIPLRTLNATAQSCHLDVSQSIGEVLYAFEDLYFVAAFLVIIVMFIRMRKSLLNFSKVYNNEAIVKRLMKNIKALKMLWPVVIVLFICMLPLAIGRTWFWVTDDNISLYFLHIIDVLLVINSACNPYLYIIVSAEFRQKFWQIPCMRVLQIRLSKDRTDRSANEKNESYAPYPNIGESLV